MLIIIIIIFVYSLLSEKDRAMATGKMHKKFGEVWPHGFRVLQADKQTSKQTDILITILRIPTLEVK